MLLELSPALARYSTFGGLNSPLHFAAAKGHLDIVALLLEKGADVNARNYCGQVDLSFRNWQYSFALRGWRGVWSVARYFFQKGASRLTLNCNG
ncbi:hypothetical protein ZWY2020_042414 [Hordeum vulgare]|nr:hypothetical protein ZWY2020_042414 [Hordeum vulgare]